MSGRANWHALATCESTNDELARLASAGAPAGTVVIAETQTAGRGRLGRSWESGARGNLYASILARPELAAAEVPPLSLVAGIATTVAVRALGVDAMIKWPNDIVLGQKKLGGILAEASSRSGRVEHVVVGIGLNIAERPTGLEEISISLDECGARCAPADLLEAIVLQLEPRLVAFERGGVPAIRAEFLELWRDRDQPARFSQGDAVIVCTVRDLAEDGGIVVEDESGDLRTVVAGDVDIDYAS